MNNTKPKSKQRLWLRFNSLALVSAMTLTCLPSTSQAGLKEAMNQMFVSASTNPQMIDTQRLKGVYGGSMALRPAGQGINILQFAPPRIDAGCGGIDVFFGSFSFINGAQFEQLVRSIAANAVGFAIKSAINGMCSPCGAILQELEAAIRELNAMAKNTCAIAKAMFDKDASDKLMERASKIGEHLKTATNRVSDALAANNQSQSEPPSKTAKGGSETAKENNPIYGNLVYRAAKETLNGGTNTLRAFLSETEAIEMILGLFGTVIVTPAPSTGATCPESSPERCDQPPLPYGPVIAEWGQLFDPEKFSDAGVKVYKCADSACEKMTTGNIPLSSWGGVQKVINLAMFGVENPSTVSSSSYTPNSIVGSYVHKVPLTNSSIDPRSKKLIEILPLPILNAMMEVQHIKGGPELLGLQIANMMPQYFEYLLATELLTIGNNVFSAQSKTSPPAGYQENLYLKAQTLKRPAATELADMMNKSIDSVRSMRALAGSNLQTSSAGSRK